MIHERNSELCTLEEHSMVYVNDIFNRPIILIFPNTSIIAEERSSLLQLQYSITTQFLVLKSPKSLKSELLFFCSHPHIGY